MDIEKIFETLLASLDKGGSPNQISSRALAAVDALGEVLRHRRLLPARNGEGPPAPAGGSICAGDWTRHG